jgi:allantoin racemase
MRLLVVNPNTTVSMTETIRRAAVKVASAQTEIVAVTSSMGPASIEGYYDEAMAVPGLLKEIAAGEASGAQAAIIACFDDTGRDAARAMAGIPVLGICEAALNLAGFIAERFTIVTTMERSRIPLEELVQRYGMSRRAKVRASDIPVLALEHADAATLDRLRAEIAAALRDDKAEAIILGCAGMAELAANLSREFGVPVVDGVGAAIKQAEGLVTLGLRTSKRGAYAAPLSKVYTGLMAPFAPAVS